MANPAPIISQINAFNATEGTIISFNIVGGTSIVRSNIIYIYDLSDNSLICTHLYISTESIHELPANTDPSIAYASGKSSADFTNGKQYYAQIQTFTNTAGTEGASGASIAKLFWCLVDPTLTINTIPSSISTTSYNVGAVYNSNTTATSNIVQQYQFNLYSATGVLVQSSGVITGSGAQQGTSTAYDLSYNFTGLSVGSSYYITVEVTTTQGMTVTAQSNTFTVSIDTPTLGEATVVNNACDGYISVTSNLSSEYGGSASGSIATFETTSVNEISSLKANIDPIQDLHGYDAPWVGGAGKNLFDVSYLTGQSANGVYFTAQNDGRVKASGTAVTQGWTYINRSFTLPYNGIDAGNQILLYGSAQLYVRFYDDTNAQVESAVTRQPSNIATTTVPSSATKMGIYVYTGYTYPSAGQTVNETLEFYISKDLTFTSWTPYTNICPISGWDSAEATVAGENLYDAELLQGYWAFADGSRAVSNGWVCTDKIPCEPSTAYIVSASPKQTRYQGFVWFDSSGAFISSTASERVTDIGYTATSPSNAGFMVFNIAGATYGEQINPSDVDGFRVGLEASTKEYTATFEETVYGGDYDFVGGSGNVTRGKWSLKNRNWGKDSTGFYTQIDAIKRPKYGMQGGMICNAFETFEDGKHYSTMGNNEIALYNSSLSVNVGMNWVYIRMDEFTTVADFKAYIDSLDEVDIVAELATPRTIQLDPQTITTLVGVNNVWADSGDVSVAYNIPITKLLVKRQDTADISGKWLTLYSQPITQASDMDFTFIDFLNQYGKTYKYALVPLLTQEQSGVEVEVEGGYTVSDEVVSIFDGVFVADNTAIYKLKAGVNYGDLSRVQEVGNINTIGSKYPIIVSNSKVDYRTASLSATIVADDYYDNGNLNRMDMVQKRELMESFFTNKRAKILKDWNGNIWLVVFTDNINITFINEYGMGIATLTATWTEIGDVTNEEDLQNTRIINVG